MTIGRYKGENFHISDDSRRRHLHIIGQTGTGKSALLANMIGQDLAAGHGLALVDPHGDLVQSVLALIPPSRASQLVYLNPADLGRPVSFNPFDRVPEDRRPAAADEIVAAFKAVWGWTPESAPRALYILRACLRTLLDTPGSSLLGIPRLLLDASYRERVVRRERDPVVRGFWDEYATWDDRYRREAIAPVLTRIGTVLSSPAVRNILCQSRSTIDLRRMMDEGRILLVNLSKGAIGEENSHLLGAFIVSGIVQAALSRGDIEERRRRVLHLYVDEFQNFATESFTVALSEARKYALTICASHQYLSQIPEQIRDAVLGNTGSVLCFRVGADDAPTMAAHLGGLIADRDLPPSVLRELANFQAVGRFLDGRAPYTFSLEMMPPPSPADDRTARLVRNSRIRFGRERRKVESAIEHFLAPKRARRRLGGWKSLKRRDVDRLPPQIDRDCSGT